MSEREGMPGWEDPADPTEKRDWDLPPELHGDAPEGSEHAAIQHHPPAEEPPPAGPPKHREPPDESEKRDWDVP